MVCVVVGGVGVVVMRVVCVVAGGVGVVRLLEELEPIALLELLDAMPPIGLGEGARPRLAVEKHTRQQEPQLPCSDGIGLIGSGGDAFKGQCEGLADPTSDELWRGLEEGASVLQCGWEVDVVQAGQCCA